MNIKDFRNEQGHCPQCKGHNLEYGSCEFEGENCYFPYKCRDCGLEGEEWYALDFIGHNVYDENGECIEL